MIINFGFIAILLLNGSLIYLMVRTLRSLLKQLTEVDKRIAARQTPLSHGPEKLVIISLVAIYLTACILRGMFPDSLVSKDQKLLSNLTNLTSLILLAVNGIYWFAFKFIRLKKDPFLDF